MEFKISIITPVFNSEKYLKDCIDSVINQTIGFENIQFILVNDGSTDSSKKILDDYSQKYSNIEVFHLTESHSIGGFARNVGLEHAIGKYLMFLDSDDCLVDTACEKMYNTITEKSADIVTANYTCMYENGQVWPNPILDSNCQSGELKKVNQDFFYLYCPSVCLKIFRNEIVKDNNIRFLGKVPAEDAYFSCHALLKSSKIYYFSDIIYYYRRRNRSSVSTSWMRNQKYFNGINYAFNEIYKLFEKNDKLDYYKYFYSKNLLSLIYKIIDTKLLTREEKLKVMDDFHWFFAQSEKLGIVFAQNSIEILLKKLVTRNYDDALMLCDVICEYRSYMNEIEKELVTKPRKIII